MNDSAIPTDVDCQALRRYFETGATRPLAWRRQQLQSLIQAIESEETAIYEALYTDLRKSPEESYATEVGLVLAEIRHTLKQLAKWMAPQKVGTNLVNL